MKQDTTEFEPIEWAEVIDVPQESSDAATVGECQLASEIVEASVS